MADTGSKPALALFIARGEKITHVGVPGSGFPKGPGVEPISFTKFCEFLALLRELGMVSIAVTAGHIPNAEKGDKIVEVTNQ